MSAPKPSAAQIAALRLAARGSLMDCGPKWCASLGGVASARSVRVCLRRGWLAPFRRMWSEYAEITPAGRAVLEAHDAR